MLAVHPAGKRCRPRSRREPGSGSSPSTRKTFCEVRRRVGWFEVHAENYMGAGGQPHRFLEWVRERYPLSVHGVGLSIGGAGRLDEKTSPAPESADRSI